MIFMATALHSLTIKDNEMTVPYCIWQNATFKNKIKCKSTLGMWSEKCYQIITIKNVLTTSKTMLQKLQG